MSIQYNYIYIYIFNVYILKQMNVTVFNNFIVTHYLATIDQTIGSEEDISGLSLTH